MEMQIEIWKDVPNYEGFYKASSMGRILSVRKNITMSPGIKKAYKTKNRSFLPYQYINLIKEGKPKTFYVHSIIALVFIGEKPSGFEVLHNDDNPLNNCSTNLKYGTHSENQKDAYKRNRRPVSIVSLKMIKHAESKKKKIISTNKHTGEQKEYSGIRIAARELNILSGGISNVIKGRGKSYSGYHFKYA